MLWRRTYLATKGYNEWYTTRWKDIPNIERSQYCAITKGKSRCHKDKELQTNFIIEQGQKFLNFLYQVVTHRKLRFGYLSWVSTLFAKLDAAISTWNFCTAVPLLEANMGTKPFPKVGICYMTVMYLEALKFWYMNVVLSERPNTVTLLIWHYLP